MQDVVFVLALLGVLWAETWRWPDRFTKIILRRGFEAARRAIAGRGRT